MNKYFKSYLFTKGILVSAGGKDSFAALFALANKFGVKITEGAALANVDLVEECEYELGEYVPESFYRGFPESVKKLSASELLFDQLYHYYNTYVQGDFSEAGHSVFENDFERAAFREDTEVRKMAIVTEERGMELVFEYIGEMLKSSRPLSSLQYDVVKNAVMSHGYKPSECVCKNTAIKLLADTGMLSFAEFIALSDVIKLAEEINYSKYDNLDIKKLQFKSKDRKLISSVLDKIFADGFVNTRDCFEKKKLWAGLLHHIHYKPRCERAEKFLNLIRGRENLSVYSEFERAMLRNDIRSATLALKEGKGSAALLRQLNYILSRCETTEDIGFVFDSLETENATVLIQLLLQYGYYKASGARTFLFTRFNKTVKHTETEEEQANRKSALSPAAVELLSGFIREKLEKLLKGRLGKVYISPEMKNIALPIQETATQSGLGVLPKGSKLPIGDGKKIRAFTYWEKVDDIDLSVIGITDRGEEIEFSWRTMYAKNGAAITFSGDQTAGYDGGSEYYDVNIERFMKENPTVKYLVFCNNVYSNATFATCLCKAGYMMRDVKDSGRVFEPKTVKSSFVVNCDSSSAYLFGIDLEAREFIWLNVANENMYHVAGQDSVSHLLRYFGYTSVINLYSLFEMLATETVSTPEEADIILSDSIDSVPEGKTVIRSCDFEKINALIEA